MAKLLHIQTSPRGGESSSVQVADALVAEYRRLHEHDEVETLDLFTADLPVFDAPAAAAKYAVLSGAEPTGQAERVWKRVVEVVDQLKSADRIVLSSPMWNFGIPYRLKHYFDVIVQPGLTFAFSPETGYTGLLAGRTTALVLARGGDYSAGTPAEAMDMQRPYLEMILRFMGLDDLHVVTIQPTLHGGPEVARQKLDEAIAKARALARTF